MGLMDWLGLSSSAVAAIAGDSGAALTTPWSSNDLSRVVWSDVTGTKAPGVTRADAMRVPSIARGRALIVGQLSQLPLVAFEGENRLSDPDQPTWLYRTDGLMSPRARTLWTLDDLMFYGVSLWNTSRDIRGRILAANRRHPELWRIENMRIELRDSTTARWRPAAPGEVVLIEGPQEGLLTIAADTIRAGLDLEAAWAQRVAAPVPLVELHNTDPNMPLTETESADLVASWEAKRKTGGTAYTPAAIQVIPHGTTATDLYVQGRNAIRLDVANYLSLPSALLEGALATASLTYSTTATKRNELSSLSLTYWSSPFEGRLSLDDMIEPGRSIRFDMAQLAALDEPATTPTGKD